MTNNEVYRWALMGIQAAKDGGYMAYQAARYTNQEEKVGRLGDLYDELTEKLTELAVWKAAHDDE